MCYKSKRERWGKKGERWISHKKMGLGDKERVRDGEGWGRKNQRSDDEKERESVCVCVIERERERVSMSVSVRDRFDDAHGVIKEEGMTPTMNKGKK